MEKEEVFHRMHNAILSLNNTKAIDAAQTVINEDFDISEFIENAMSPAIEEVGKKFQSGELFLPELQKAGDIFLTTMDILQTKLMEKTGEVKAKGRVLIGTVKGDLHSIGKDLVATMLKTSGFKVVDLGIDVPTFTFLEEAQKNEVDIIGLSALLTTTMPVQGEIIEALESQGLREKFRVIVGGGPVDQAWADRIGADEYGENAAEAVELAKRLCSPGG